MLLASASTAIADPYRTESAGEGRAVYLVPGLASPGWVWNDLAERLRAAGYRTHVLTLAGFAGEAFIPDLAWRLASTSCSWAS